MAAAKRNAQRQLLLMVLNGFAQDVKRVVPQYSPCTDTKQTHTHIDMFSISSVQPTQRNVHFF